MSEESPAKSAKPDPPDGGPDDLAEFSESSLGKPGDKYRALYEALPGETGWDRVKMLFLTNEWGQSHPDLETTIHGTFAAGFTGAVIGGFIGARMSIDEFIEKNHATKFYSEVDAKRRLNDHVMYGTLKHSFKVAWRLSLFTGLFLFSSAVLTNYRNKTHVLDFSGAGFIAGSLYKLKLGPKPMLVGGVTGGVLGTLAGLAFLGLSWACGTSLQEANFWRMQYQIVRETERHERLLERRRKKAMLMQPQVQDD